ncbi:MAG: alpha/beta hydrolase, partial [Gammaproteobacteria bacterium]
YVPTLQNRAQVPYPNDIFFSGSTDGTLNIPGTLSSTGSGGVNLPSVNKIDGYSVNASIRVPLTGPIDITSVVPYLPSGPGDPTPAIPNPNLFILDTNLGLPLIPLVPGVTDAIAQYTYRVSAATDANGEVLEIVPLRPLNPDTTYAFYMISGILDTSGNVLTADNQFAQIRDAYLAGETLDNASLEALKNLAVAPLLDAAIGLLGIPGPAIACAWSASTLSVSDSLDWIVENATPQAIAAQPTGLTTAAVIPGVPGIADIYAGFLDVPYYLSATDPYGRGWLGAGGTDLTRFNPIPEATSTQRIPLLATVPNAGSGQTKPAEGWPVVLFQHGLVVDRTYVLPIADSFASQGFVVLSIDLPLHGIVCPVDDLACNPLLVPPGNELGIVERNFYLDLFDNDTYAPTPDGFIDDGGQPLAVSLTLPVIGRDLLRQGAADLITLKRSLAVLDLDGDQVPDIDTTRVHHVSFSTGTLIGADFLGVETGIATATLAHPGGTISDILLLDPDAKNFGRPLQQGLAARGIVPGTLNYDQYVRDYQTVLDAGDPLSYAVAASTNTPINAHQVLFDQTLVNAASEKWARVAGLTPAGVPGAADPAGVRAFITFDNGGHVSILNPAAEIVDADTGEVLTPANPAVTAEMQTQAVSFAVTNGTQLPITCTGSDC